MIISMLVAFSYGLGKLQPRVYHPIIAVNTEIDHPMDLHTVITQEARLNQR